MRGARFILLSTASLAIFVAYTIIFTTSPYRVSTQIFILLYASLTLAIASTYTLIQVWITPRVLSALTTRTTLLAHFRLGVLMGLVISTLLILKALRTLGFFDALFICTAAVLFELFFRVRMPIYRKE